MRAEHNTVDNSRANGEGCRTYLRGLTFFRCLWLASAVTTQGEEAIQTSVQEDVRASAKAPSASPGSCRSAGFTASS